MPKAIARGKIATNPRMKAAIEKPSRLRADGS